jgi:hypothetical protein
MSQGDEKIFSLSGVGPGCSCVGFEGKTKTCDVVVYAESEYGLAKQFTTTVSVDCVSNVVATNPSSVIQPARNEVLELPYIDYNGSNLYIHPTDNSAGTDWGCQGIAIGTSDTDGAANTAAIVGGCSTEGIAARLCSDLSFDGYTDWYLPAKDQLVAVDAQKNDVNKGDYAAQWADFGTYYYWSSTEWSAGPEWSVWLVFLGFGPPGTGGKNGTGHVRCVRSD